MPLRYAAPLVALLVVAALAVAALGGPLRQDVAPPASRAAVAQAQGDFESGDFSEFNGGANVSNATLSVDAPTAYTGGKAARATVKCCTNAYARTLREVSWANGETVAYGVAMYLPPGFKAAQKGVALMRWDNYDRYGSSADQGGVWIFGGDRKAHMTRGTYSAGFTRDYGSFDLPEGEWFWLEARQKLSGGTDGSTQVYLNGEKVLDVPGQSTGGRPITRLRTGIVADAASSQSTPLTLYFDRQTVGPDLLGPKAGAPSGGGCG